MTRLLLVVIAIAMLSVTASAASERSDADSGPSGRIAFSYRYWPEDDRIVDNYEIFVMKVADSTSQNLTRFPRCSEISPAWSHSGRWIAFACAYGPSVGISVMRDDRTGRRRVVRGVNHKVGDPAWSADDRQLAFKGARGISKVNVDGSGLHQLTGRADGSPTWSADSRAIAFDRNVRGVSHVVKMRANGTGQRRIARDACCPSWSPNGRSIAFLRKGSIWLMNREGGGQRRLPGVPRGLSITDLAWSPDGRYLAFYVYCCRESGIYVLAADGRGRRRLSYGPEFQGIAWGPNP